MRHRNPLFCTMAHTAFYLFYRWNVANKLPPCFRQYQLWYGLHLLKGKHAAKQMAYDTQLDWIIKMFTGANVTSPKKTQAQIQSRARVRAQAQGVGIVSIQLRGTTATTRRRRTARTSRLGLFTAITAGVSHPPYGPIPSSPRDDYLAFAKDV